MMPRKKDNFLKRFLKSTRWFSLVSVIVLFVSMGILILIGMYKLYIIIEDILLSIQNFQDIDMNLVSARILNIIDIYLLVVVLYIFAIGLYKLLIGPFEGYTWMEIDDINDLKQHITKMIILFLATFLVQKIVEYDDPEKMLSFGSIITAIIAVLTWFIISLRVKKNHQNHDLNKP